MYRIGVTVKDNDYYPKGINPIEGLCEMDIVIARKSQNTSDGIR